jgi:hypothetical protein
MIDMQETARKFAVTEENPIRHSWLAFAFRALIVSIVLAVWLSAPMSVAAQGGGPLTPSDYAAIGVAAAAVLLLISVILILALFNRSQRQWLAQQLAQQVAAIEQELQTTQEQQGRLKADFAQQQAQFEESVRQEYERQRLDWEQYLAQLEQHMRQEREQQRLELERFKSQYVSFSEQAIETLGQIIVPHVAEVEEKAFTGPYLVGPAIVDPYDFYDRQSAANQFYEGLLSTQVASMSILGLYRSGKTSFLRYVSHPETMQERLGQRRDEFLLIYIDLQGGIASPDDFYAAIIRETVRTLALRHGMATPTLPKRSVVTRIDLEKVLDLVGKAGLRAAFLLDDLEVLCSAAFDPAFFTDLSAVATSRQAAWVIASFRPLTRLSRGMKLDESSPFHQLFSTTPIYLGGFSDEEARRLIAEPAARVGLAFLPEEIVFVQRLAGRLPFALQTAAWQLFRVRQQGHSGKAAESTVTKNFVSAMGSYFLHYWNQFDEGEREVAKLVSSRPQKLGTYIKQHGDAAVTSLMNYGIVEREAAAYCLSSEGFARWIKSQER